MATTTEPIAVPQVKAARLLGVTDRTLRTWTKAKRLNPVRCGAVLLYPLDELRRLKGWQKQVVKAGAAGGR